MVCVIEQNFQKQNKTKQINFELVSSVGTKLNPIKTQHNREIRPRENHRTRLSYIYISVEDSREFPSCGDEITQSNSRRTSGFTVFYGEIEDEEEEGSRN
ncbi:hypothetical protein YC2023_066521 [Brassica napus]